MNYIDYSDFFGVEGFHAFMSNRDQDFAILEHRKCFADALGLNRSQLVIPQQVHSNEVVRVSGSCTLPDTDGTIAQEKDVVLSIQVADCIPLFLLNTASHTFGLIHSGWRGTQLKIGPAALQEMVHDQPGAVRAVIGPSIGQCCFEVGLEVADVFDSSWSIPGNGDRHMLDLKSVVKDQLIEAGLENNNILVDNQCTFCEKDKYFSYRRDGNKAGRMVAIAGWSETSF